MDFEKKDKVDPYRDTNLPEDSGPAKVEQKNLQTRAKPNAAVSWLVAFIPIIVIVVLIILLNKPKEEGIKQFDDTCMEIHPMGQDYNCLATIEKDYKSGLIDKQVGVYMKECIARNLPNSV